MQDPFIAIHSHTNDLSPITSGSMTELLHSSLGDLSNTPGAYSGTTARSSLGSDLYMNGHNLGNQNQSDYNSHSTPLWSPFYCNNDYPNSIANNSTLMLSQLLLQVLICIFSEAKIQQISEQDLIITQNPTFMHIYVENVTLKICTESPEKVYNELVASRGTAPHVQTEEIQEPTPKDHEGYPDIVYWYKHDQLDEWKRREEFKLNNGVTSDSCRGSKLETDNNIAFWFSNTKTTWVKSKVKCKCPCMCRVRSKGKSKSMSKSPSKYKYKDEDKTESEKLQRWEGTTCCVSKMQEESKDDDMEDDKGQDDREEEDKDDKVDKDDKEDKEDKEDKVDKVDKEVDNNNNNNNSKSDKGDSSDDDDLNLLDPPEPLYSSQSTATSGQLCKSLQEDIDASQTQLRPHTTQAATSRKGKSTPCMAPSIQSPLKVKLKAHPVYTSASRKEKSKTLSDTPEDPPAPIINPTPPTPSNDTTADSTNFNPNPLANVIWTTPPASAPENMDTCEDGGPNHQHDSGSNSSNVPPMAPPSNATTPAPDASTPDARTLMAPPSKVPTPIPDAGALEARTLMAPPSRAATPVPTRDTSEPRCVSTAPSNNAPMPGPSSNISDSKCTLVALLSNTPTPSPSSSILESGLGMNSNTLREGKAKAKKPVPMHPEKAMTTSDPEDAEGVELENNGVTRTMAVTRTIESQEQWVTRTIENNGQPVNQLNLYMINYLKVHSVTREEFAKVWVNLDEATKEIYKQWEMDVKSTAESSSA
ncbi:hypothetical protein EI94DRAFT_1695854 [Lactarius quietus]|nr:hypothetical protein EI94DRAFT_1695854 [Lactarius quietus]